MLDLSISEQLMYSTVRIESILSNGQVSTGTGFIFDFLEDGHSPIPAIVTNKHVVEGAVIGKFSLTDSLDNGEPNHEKQVVIQLEQFQQRWIFHPDEQVDLCILPIAWIINEARTNNQKPFYLSLNKTFIPSNEDLNDLKAIENIIMVGYPNGIWDSINNLPIFRRGITAIHPKFNYEGLPYSLIDAACFPGSSGSPVLILDEGGYVDKKGNTNLGATRIILLGVLFAGPQHTAEGEIKVINVPTSQKEIAISTIPNNLGFIVKSQKILDFEDILKELL